MGQATTQTDESVEKAGVLEGVGGLSARVNSALFGRFVNAHSFRTGKVDEFGPDKGLSMVDQRLRVLIERLTTKMRWIMKLSVWSA